MTATSTAREDLAALSAHDRESNKAVVIVAELLVEQNDLFRELLEQLKVPAVTYNVAPAGTPEGAGRSAVGTPPTPDKEAVAVRLTEPDVPSVDEDQADNPGGRPTPVTAPAKKAAAKATPAKKAGRASA